MSRETLINLLQRLEHDVPQLYTGVGRGVLVSGITTVKVSNGDKVRPGAETPELLSEALMLSYNSIRGLLVGPPDVEDPWIPVGAYLPKFSRKGPRLGTPVLIWPPDPPGKGNLDGFAFYGVRLTARPCFYLFGAEITGVQFWRPMPSGPDGSTRAPRIRDLEER